MRILITGIRGFLGSVLGRQAEAAGWGVSGTDLDLYQADGDAHYQFTGNDRWERPRFDFRELRAEELVGFHAVVHLAGISSDPACDLRTESAANVNGAAAVELARLAKRAGVPRFVFASTCSVYGSAPQGVSTERSTCAPLSTYASAKLDAEAGIRALATSTFSPTMLRFATLYGLSTNLRSDLVVNSMVTSARLRGEINLHGTGEQSRPLLHVRDAASTILDVLKASEDEMCAQVFNVTDETTGYSVAEMAERVRRFVPGSRIVHHPGATDRRHYRVDGTRIHQFCTRRSVRLDDGIAELAGGLVDSHWQGRASAQHSNRAQRLRHLLEQNDLNDQLRWRN